MTPMDLARAASQRELTDEEQRALVMACGEDEELAAFVHAYRDVHALTGLAAAATSRRRSRSRHRTQLAIAAAAAFVSLAAVALALRFLPVDNDVALASIRLSVTPAVVRTQPPLEAPATLALAGWEPKPGQWLTSMDDARAIAAATHRPVLLFVYHPTCPWCVAMNRVTWPDARVAELTAKAIPVKINVEETTKEFQKQLTGWPYIALEEPGGKVLRAFPGFHEADDMSAELRTGLQEADLETALSWDDARRFAAALASGREAEGQGRLGEALAAYRSLFSAPGAFAEEAKDGERRIAESARRALLQAQHAAQADVGDAMTRLDEAAQQFRGTPHAKDLERVREALAKTGRFPTLSVRREVG